LEYKVKKNKIKSILQNLPNTAPQRGICDVHWTLGTAARRDGVPHALRAVKHFAKRGFEFSLLPSRIHARPSASNAHAQEARQNLDQGDDPMQGRESWRDEWRICRPGKSRELTQA
jgi:hypothetical protein